MCSIKWRCFWRPLVTLNPQTTQIFAFFVAIHIFAVRQVGILILIHRLAIASPSIRTTKCPWKGRGYVTWPILNLEGTIILLMHDAMRYMPSSCVCLSVCLTHNGDFAIILHKIGCHGTSLEISKKRSRSIIYGQKAFIRRKDCENRFSQSWDNLSPRNH